MPASAKTNVTKSSVNLSGTVDENKNKIYAKWILDNKDKLQWFIRFYYYIKWYQRSSSNSY